MVNKLLAAATTDVAAETEGAYFEFAPGGGYIARIKLARAGALNGAFQRDLEKRTRPYRTGTRDNEAKIPDDVLKKINADLYATHIVKGWYTDDVGVEYSVDEARKMLLASSAFMEWCINTASAAENFRQINIDENAGN